MVSVSVRVQYTTFRIFGKAYMLDASPVLVVDCLTRGHKELKRWLKEVLTRLLTQRASEILELQWDRWTPI